MSSPAIDTTYVFGNRTTLAAISPIAPDPRLAPEAPRTLCGHCGRPLATTADHRGLPEHEGAWLCWDAEHRSYLRAS